MNYKKIYILFPFLFLGCSNNENLIQIKKEEVKVKSSNMKFTNFEKELIRISAKTSENYNNFYFLLKERKKIEREKPQYHIPKKMGKKLTINFEGYSGLLIKAIADKINYVFILDKMNITDTKIISKQYKETTVNDILEDLSLGNGFNIIINEKERIITLKTEE
jgi:hypothetical protein